MDNMPSLADIAAVTDGKTDGFNGGFWIFALIILFAMMGGGFKLLNKTCALTNSLASINGGAE